MLLSVFREEAGREDGVEPCLPPFPRVSRFLRASVPCYKCKLLVSSLVRTSERFSLTQKPCSNSMGCADNDDDVMIKIKWYR